MERKVSTKALFCRASFSCKILRVPVVATDKQGRALLAAVGRPDDSSYAAAAEEMAELLLEMGARTKWERSEKHHIRGDFPSANYGGSYGQGQRRPQRLAGERQEMMRNFVSQPCTQRIAAFQSGTSTTLQFLTPNQFLQRPLPFGSPRATVSSVGATRSSRRR